MRSTDGGKRFHCGIGMTNGGFSPPPGPAIMAAATMRKVRER
jgi:hypothetical protein